MYLSRQVRGTRYLEESAPKPRGSGSGGKGTVRTYIVFLQAVTGRYRL